MSISLYLAGPEVFLPDAHQVLQNNKKLCTHKGFTAFTPFDGELPLSTNRDLSLAKEIFEANCKLIDQTTTVIANCNFFRGACVDDGTSFEIGYAFAKGKQIWGYRSDLIPLHTKTAKLIPVSQHNSGYMMDADGYLLNEDFGNSINLMLEFSILKSGGKLVIGGLTEVLEEIVKGS
ncbi:nucleoside 2-deoxyribosyltransferase [Leptospira sp. 96542]|nr:nucleoside 2-deoxyribosyltransferase [Leptospira sp. 96542]